MKDNKLLGKTDGATVNAQTDMTFQLSDNFNLDAYKPQENVEVGVGDVATGLAVGASGAMEGAAETTKAVGQGIGEGMTDLARYVGVPDSAIETAKNAAAYTPQGMALSYVDNLGKAYGQAKDWLSDSLSDGGKQALQTSPINESPEGNWRVSSDPAVWGMQIAQGVGYMAPTIASAVATGGMSASSAIPSLTKLAIKSGANPQLAAKAAEKAYQVLRNTPAATVGISSDIGSQGIQAKETVMNAPLDQLAESNVFRSNFFTVDEDPENVGRSDSEKLDMARQMTAEQASRATMSDEKVLATSALATMLGDVPLANMLTRGASKASSSITRGVAKGATEGAIREGVTEAIQGGTQQYVANEISNEYAGTNVDLMDGVALGAVNEGVLGGAIGGTLGAVGGTRTRGDKARDNADAIENDMAQAAEPEGNTQNTDDSQLVEDVQGMESALLPSNDETMITDGPSEAAERVRQQILDKALSEGNQEWEKPEVDGQGDLTSRFKASQQLLRDKGVLPDSDNHFVKTVKLAYAMDQDKADALLERIEQGDQEAEQSLYVLAEQASELGLDETGVQQAFNAAKEKQQAAQDKRDSKIQRYIEAIEQGRENIAASSQPEAQPDLAASLSFDEQQNSDLPTEAAYQQQAIQESVKANVEQSAQSRGEFANRPNTMKMREEGKKPIADYAAFTKKTKSMRKRLKKRMARSNPQLRDALLESLRNAPERIAAFKQEAKERKARFDALPENQVRRQQVEALFDPQKPEPANEPDFSRNAIKQVMDDMRERGEPIIQSLPKEEQAEARADLRKAQSFATTKLRMMIDEAQSDNTPKEPSVDRDKIINVSGLKLVLPEISKETESTYNRATHIGRGRDFNAELAEEAKKIAGDLDEKGLLDTEDRQQKAQSLIEDYLNEEKAFIERESARAASNPSWFVTGRGGRNMAKYSAKADKNMTAFSREVEKLSAMRKRISQDVEAVMNEEQRQARQEKERRDNLSRAEKKAAEYLAIIAQNMREGMSALAKDDRKWAGPKALTHINLLASADEARAKALAKKMNEGFQDLGGVLKVAGPRSKLAARLKELIVFDGDPNNSPASKSESSATPIVDEPYVLKKGDTNQAGVRTKTSQNEKPLIGTKKRGESEAVMLSREGVTLIKPSSKGMSYKQAELGVRQWLKEYNGGAGIKTKVVQTQAEAEKLLGQSIPDATIHGFYSDRDGAVVLVADNLPDMKTLRKKLRHEVLVHHGLKAVVGDSEYQKIMERIARGRNSPHVKGIWERIEKHYGDQAPIIQVEEVLAHAAEVERSAIQRWWDTVIEAIISALRKVGFIRPTDITTAEMNNIVQTLIDRVKSVNHWDPNSPSPGSNTSKLSRSKLSQAKFSLQQESARFSDELRKAMGSLKSRVAPIKVSDTPDVLKALGMPELPLYIDRDVVRKATNGVKDDHDISMESIYRLPELLADPIAVFKPKAPNIAATGSKNIIVAAQSDTGKPVLIAIHADKTSHRIRVNSVASAYGKNEKALTQWIKDGLLEYVKENNPEWLRLQGLQLPEERTFHQGYLDKIMSHQDVVNMGGIKFSKTSSPTMDEVIRQIDSEPTAHGRLRTALRAVATAVKGELGGKKGLGAVTLRQLADLAKDKLPQIKGYVDTVHRMMERRNQMAFESAEIAQSIRKWAAKNKPMADEMFDIAHQATVEGVDPAESFVSAAEAIQNRIRHIENVAKEDALTNAQADELRQLRNDLNDEPRRLRKHIALRKRFDKLPAEAKTHYRTMRDNYKARHDDYRRLLEQQIQNAEIDGRVKKKRLAELRSLFDLQEVNAPYFPLARFGDYWVHAIDENGESRYLMFESEAEQQQTVKGLREKGFEVRSGYKMEGNPAIDGASLSFVTDLMGRIDETSLNDKKKTEIKDQIYQMYLQALPSRSMRKQFIHRKKTQGWSNDALRAMAENMMKGAYQLSRMEYAEELTKQVKETEKAAKLSNDNQAGRYAEELMKRHQWVMNPTHSVAAQKITSLGFLWMLGVSPAAAAVNTTQNFVVALPIMASKFGSTAATKALNGAMREFITSRGQISRKFRNQSEKDAYNAWHDMGLLDSTNAHDLAGMAEAENWKYNETYEKAMGVVSWLFHKAEVFNRETTAIAAYRLARQNGHEHDAATKMAADITWDAHFDYTNANRARYMQAPSMKVIMQFKQYSQNMTYYLLRNLYLSMKGASNSERAEARKQLIGTLGITALLGGATALPLGTLFAVANGLNAAFGDDDKPWDAEIEFKNYLGELLGEGLADKVIYGAGGAGVSSRISLDGLWVRDPSRDLEGEDLWTHYAKQVAGPVLGGIVVSAISGGHDISDGNIYRGVEKMMPKFARDPMKAYRYWDEGALNYRGNAYKEADQFTGLQLLLQANGLTDGELMKQYDLNNAIKGYEQHILDRRRDLMTAYWLAYKQNDEPMMLETKRSIYKFNQANPGVAIDSQALRSSIKTRRRYNRDSNSGINVSKKLSYLQDEFAW